MRSAEQLVAVAAAELADDGDLTADPEAWRDQAVLTAVRSAWGAGDTRAVRELALGYDRVLRRRPVVDGGRVVLRVAPTAARRRLGAWATGPEAADELARLALPDAVRVGAVCDPACGAGALLRAALARLAGLGLPPGDAARLLHGVDVDPVAAEVARTVLAVDVEEAGGRMSPDGLADRVVVGDSLAGPVPAIPDATASGLVWHETFPHVLRVEGAPREPVTGWRGGFSAVLANPPWERIKVLKGEHRDVCATGLESRRIDVRAVAQALRDSGRHPLTGNGELNAYLLFAETCWRLLAPDGRAALLAPVGLVADLSAVRLLHALLDAGALESVHVRSNGDGSGRRTVPDLQDRQRVAVTVLRGGRREAGLARARVDDGGTWPLDRSFLRTVNPNSGTAPLCRGARDARLLGEVHERVGVLLRRDADGDLVDDPWHVRLRTPLHLTRDERHLRHEPAPGLLPLWEAKLAGLLDHRCGTWAGRRTRASTERERHDLGWEPTTRWWVPADVTADRLAGVFERGWMAAFRNTTTASAERTLLPCAVPAVGIANSLPVVEADRLPLLLAALASMPIDWAARQKLGGSNLSLYKVEQLPVPPPAAYDVPAPWSPSSTVGEWVTGRLADAVAWSAALRPLAVELGLDAVPRTCPERRAQALAELDAVHAWLLGLTRADLAHVLMTFTRLRAREEVEHGRFVTQDRVLAAFDVLGLDAAA